MYYDHNKSILFFKYDIYDGYHIYPYIEYSKIIHLESVIRQIILTKTFVRVC